MTIFLDTPRLPANATFAGGVGSLADIAAAARDSLLYVDNAYASSDALQRVLNDRRRAIHDATGVQLADPMTAAHEEFRQKAQERSIAPFSDRWTHDDRPETLDEIYDRHLDAFSAELSTLAEKFPDAAETIGAGRNLWDDTAELARKSDERLGQLMASRSGLGKYGALLAGGMAGALADPITVMSIAAGGGPGGAATVAGRILTIAGKEALINAATEAAIQPSVQAWRERAGLDHGMNEAIRNVLFAGVMGGAFGGALGGAGELASRFLRPADTDRAAATLAGDSRLSEDARAILAGDGQRAANALAEIRAALPAEARGALDAAESIRLADDAKPASASRASHETALSVADRAVRFPDESEAWPGFTSDADQIARVVRAIAGEQPAGTTRPDTPLVDFLIDRGGVADFKGELRAIGAAEISERFRGRLVKDDGESLDYAREAAAQAGFFDHLYGDAETAANRSTVADLLDVLEEEVRVRTGGTVNATEEAAMASLEGMVADLARIAGPGVEDRLLTRAARMVTDEGLDPFDAIERAVMAEPLPQARGEQAKPMPGWSDAELLAASEHRGAWPVADGIDDPARLMPEDMAIDEAAGVAHDLPYAGAGDSLAIQQPAEIKIDLVGGTMAALVKAVRSFAREHFGGKTVTNASDSAEIIIAHRGIKHALSGAVSRPQVAAALRLDELLTSASYAGSLPDRHGRPHVRAAHYYDRDITFGGTTARIRAVVMEHDDGRRYYDHFEFREDGGSGPGDRPEGPSLQEAVEPPPARNIGESTPDDNMADDLLIPTDDGMRSVAEIRADIERRENLAALVEACKA